MKKEEIFELFGWLVGWLPGKYFIAIVNWRKYRQSLLSQQVRSPEQVHPALDLTIS